MICAKCSDKHADIVCDCGHCQCEHIFGMGCHKDRVTVHGYIKSGCTCPRYSQTHLRKYSESTRDFNKRVGYVAA